MNTQLYLKARILYKGGQETRADVDFVAPVNNLLHSLFSQVEVFLNGRSMGHSNSL
jgi:hypothetical protein